MSDPSDLQLQKAIRARLVGTAAVTALVPAKDIIDGQGLPARFPSVIIGETQTVRDSITLARQHVRIYATIHCWTAESGLERVKRLAGAVAIALRAPLALDAADVWDGTVDEIRTMRDPDGEHSHGVVTFAALVRERV